MMTEWVGDSKEGYYVGVPIPESDPRSRKPLHGPNQYPSPGEVLLWFNLFYSWCFDLKLELSIEPGRYKLTIL